MKTLLAILILGCLLGCSTQHSLVHGKMLRYPNRLLEDWQPDKAIAEAQRDIATGTAKIYISGTEAPYAPGVSSDRYAIVRTLPRADAGIGCDVDDAELRKAQVEYARLYNEYVVTHISKR